MVETALTHEQQDFAAEHHGLVYAFLNEKRLPDDGFYDIVVFGYLKAVKDYLNNLKLSQKYEFSTIAFTKMNDTLCKHNEYLNRQMRKAHTINLEATIYGDDEIFSLQEIVSAPDSKMMDFETELIMLELASKVSKREMDVIRMKANGCGIREIAKIQHIPMKGVAEMLAGLRGTVLAACYE